LEGAEEGIHNEMNPSIGKLLLEDGEGRKEGRKVPEKVTRPVKRVPTKLT
jgi:hypothetical protein